jgi:hypothetical protein
LADRGRKFDATLGLEREDGYDTYRNKVYLF